MKLAEWSLKKKIVVAAVAVLGLIVAIGLVTDPEGDPPQAKQDSGKSSDSKGEKKPKPKSKDIDAQAVIKEFESASGGRKIADMGDYTTWHPYFQNAKDSGKDSILVNLSVPGDFDKGEQKELAEKAGTHILNFTGERFPKLDHIIVYVDGIDRATVYRRDLPLLNR